MTLSCYGALEIVGVIIIINIIIIIIIIIVSHLPLNIPETISDRGLDPTSKDHQ